MPLYFFIIQFSEGELDDTVPPLANDASARSYAERVIRELKSEEGYDGSGLGMIVKDGGGRIVLSIPF